MDPFAIVVVVALLALVLWTWLIGRHAPGQGGAVLGLRTPREIVEDREALEAEDLAQMLEAHNARRRRRGQPEETAQDIERQVMEDVHEHLRRREVP